MKETFFPKLSLATFIKININTQNLTRVNLPKAKDSSYNLAMLMKIKHETRQPVEYIRYFI